MIARAAVIALPVAVAAAVVATAPTAAAQPQCTDVAPGTTRCGSPGNVQINTAPTQTGPYLPYVCDPQYGALCDDGVTIGLGPIFDHRGRR